MDAARPTHTVLTLGRMWRMVSNTAMPVHALATSGKETPLQTPSPSALLNHPCLSSALPPVRLAPFRARLGVFWQTWTTRGNGG